MKKIIALFTGLVLITGVAFATASYFDDLEPGSYYEDAANEAAIVQKTQGKGTSCGRGSGRALRPIESWDEKASCNWDPEDLA